MSHPKVPRDVVGNTLAVGDLVCGQFSWPTVFKVVAVEHGGIHTAQGITPAKVRLVADVNLTSMPGIPFIQLIRVLSPTSQELVDAIMSNLPSKPPG